MEKISKGSSKKNILAGLTSTDVLERIEAGKVNKTLDNSRKYWQIVMLNIFTFFNILLFGIGIWLFSVGAYSDLMFLFVIFANMGIGIYQEVKSKMIISKLSILSSPTAFVIRDDEEVELQVCEVVLDDLIILKAGKQIPADAIVKKGNIETNESLLTGESDIISKAPGSVIFGGSYVVSGTCYAVVNAVGTDTYMNSMTNDSKKLKKPKSEILKALNVFIKLIAVIVIPIGILTFYNNMDIAGVTYNTAVVKTAAGVIGIIPSGLYLMTSTALAVGSIKLAKMNTLVQNLYCIEMLARVDVLCLDKTGTITDGTMVVDEFICEEHKSKEQKIIASMMFHLNDSNETALALIERFGKNDFYKADIILPFSSVRKYSGVTFDKIGTYILGAPEFVVKKMTDKDKRRFSEYTKMGKRVLVLAHSKETISNKGVKGDVSIIGIITIDDNIREDAYETLKYFEENDVHIKVISGDNAFTVASIAKKAGVKNADKFISLHDKTDEEVIDAADKYIIFGRVIPHQKKLLIETLKKQDHTVGMIGDGVNDILALSAADCSIAMASGSEAARNVSHLVLLDSNFSSMPVVVKEGRRVINNVANSASLFLMKTVYSLLLVLITLYLAEPYPFRPVQMTLIEFFIIGVPAFALTFEANDKRVPKSFIVKAIKTAIPASLVVAINIALLYTIQDYVGLTDNEISTIGVITTLFTGLVLLYNISIPLNKFRALLILLMTTFCSICIVFMNDYFEIGITDLSLYAVLVLIVLIQAINPILRLIKKALQTSDEVLTQLEETMDEIIMKNAEKIKEKKAKRARLRKSKELL